MRAKAFLVTGGSGFLGRALINRLVQMPGCSVMAPLRTPSATLPKGARSLRLGNLDGTNDWATALTDVEVVVHAAARVHVMNEKALDPLAAFREVNVEATLNLARQAAACGVKRFIFISSIKVNGEGTERGAVYRPDDVPAPVDPYGISKFEAEKGLRELAATTGMEVVIIRPVLVYGPGVKANFLSMMRWLYRGIPLPFGAVDNRRSLVAIDNLVDLIVTCSDHPAAANQVFLVSDGEDVSTSQLLHKLAAALGKPARLLPVPTRLLRGVAGLLGRRALADRILGSLQVDISKNRQLLGWIPPVTLDQALALTVQHFLDSHKS